MKPATKPVQTATIDEALKKQPAKQSKKLLLFILKFALLFILFEVCYFNEYLYQHVFFPVNNFFASATGKVLGWIGIPAQHQGDTISNAQFSMSVKQGCDSMEALAIFVCGVIAFPSNMSIKLKGLLIGSLIILTLNLVRLIHLFWVGINQRDLFDLFHLEIWQGFFIILSISLWIIWVIKASKPDKL